jgi:hypothetical protein
VPVSPPAGHGSVITAIIARSVDPGLVRARVFVLFVVLLAAMVPLVRFVPEDHGTR